MRLSGEGRAPWSLEPSRVDPQQTGMGSRRTPEWGIGRKASHIMRRISVIFGMALTLILISAAAAFGQAAGGIVIPVDTYIAAEPGSLAEIAQLCKRHQSWSVRLVGAVAVAENGESVHETMTSSSRPASTSAMLADVEGESFKVTPATGADFACGRRSPSRCDGSPMG